MFLNISEDYPFPNDITSYETVILTGTDVTRARPLWEEVFSTDSKAFCDYYFSQKIYDNTTFVCMDKDQIIASVHMTDYTMIIDGESHPTKYVVGVATKESYRHQGIMAHLLNCAFQYFQDKISFVFLMPADPAIYTPFDFQYVYSRTGYHSDSIFHDKEKYLQAHDHLDDLITVDIIDAAFIKSDVYNENYLQRLSDFANQALSDQYDYYLLHTPEYFQKLILELHSENGYMFVFKKENQVIGYFTFATEDETDFIQEVLLDQTMEATLRQNYTIPVSDKKEKPLIMVKNLRTNPTDYIHLLSNKKGLLNEIV